jgi:hypothetical protein
MNYIELVTLVQHLSYNWDFQERFIDFSLVFMKMRANINKKNDKILENQSS